MPPKDHRNTVICPQCRAFLAHRVGRSWIVTIGDGISMSATGGLVCRCGGEAALPDIPLPPMARYETRKEVRT